MLLILLEMSSILFSNSGKFYKIIRHPDNLIWSLNLWSFNRYQNSRACLAHTKPHGQTCITRLRLAYPLLCRGSSGQKNTINSIATFELFWMLMFRDCNLSAELPRSTFCSSGGAWKMPKRWVGKRWVIADVITTGWEKLLKEIRINITSFNIYTSHVKKLT